MKGDLAGLLWVSGSPAFYSGLCAFSFFEEFGSGDWAVWEWSGWDHARRLANGCLIECSVRPWGMWSLGKVANRREFALLV